jgi:hypothetical protein
VRDRRIEVLRAIDAVDRRLSELAEQNPPDLSTRVNHLLDRRLELALQLDQLTHLGFLVTDRRKIR